MIAALFSQFWPYIVGGIALIAAYFGIKAKGSSEAKQEMAIKTAEKAAEASKAVKDVQKTIDAINEGAAPERLRTSKWVRDK